MGVRFISGEPGLRAEGLACAMSEATPGRLRAQVEDARTELVEASLLSGVAFYSQGLLRRLFRLASERLLAMP